VSGESQCWQLERVAGSPSLGFDDALGTLREEHEKQVGEISKRLDQARVLVAKNAVREEVRNTEVAQLVAAGRPRRGGGEVGSERVQHFLLLAPAKQGSSLAAISSWQHCKQKPASLAQLLSDQAQRVNGSTAHCSEEAAREHDCHELDHAAMCHLQSCTVQRAWCLWQSDGGTGAKPRTSTSPPCERQAEPPTLAHRRAIALPVLRARALVPRQPSRSRQKAPLASGEQASRASSEGKLS